MSSTTKAEPKTAPVSKSELLLDVASEAKILRSSEGISMVVIPNHPTKKRPVSLFDSFDFVCWLTWRCHCKHGFLPSSALINTILRALAGKALFDSETVVIEITSPLPQPGINVKPAVQHISAPPVNTQSKLQPQATDPLLVQERVEKLFLEQPAFQNRI